MKISKDYESFNDQKVENIAKELIKSKIIVQGGFDSSLYKNIQKVAGKLGFMDKESLDLDNGFVLVNDDFLKVIDKIWEYVTSGILAPGSNWENPWFPHLHLTEKGKKLLEK